MKATMPKMPQPCPMVLPSGWIRYTADQLRARDAEVWRLAMEQAAQAALNEKVRADETAEPEDQAYNAACEHIAAAIRSLPMPAAANTEEKHE